MLCDNSIFCLFRLDDLDHEKKNGSSGDINLLFFSCFNPSTDITITHGPKSLVKIKYKDLYPESVAEVNEILSSNGIDLEIFNKCTLPRTVSFCACLLISMDYISDHIISFDKKLIRQHFPISWVKSFQEQLKIKLNINKVRKNLKKKKVKQYEWEAIVLILMIDIVPLINGSYQMNT